MRKLVLLLVIAALLVLAGCEKEVCSGTEQGDVGQPVYTVFYVEGVMPCVRVAGGGLSCDWSQWRSGQ